MEAPPKSNGERDILAVPQGRRKGAPAPPVPGAAYGGSRPLRPRGLRAHSLHWQ